jgi:hypothetical protein
VDTAEAAGILAADSFIAKAQAHVVTLVGTSQRSAYIYDRGEFAAVQGTYPITFTIAGTPVISPATQKAVITAAVTTGQPPLITAATPLEVWIGNAADKPAGAITAAQYTPTYQVTATDPDSTPTDISAQVVAHAIGAPVNTAVAGTYHLRFEVTDSDNNQVSADRLVVVNDGGYKVGAGRVLAATGFVIKAEDVATTAADKLIQVRGQTQATLIAGANESGAVKAADVLPADQISFDLGNYTNIASVYTIKVRGVDFPLSAPLIERTVTAQVLDTEVLDQIGDYYVFGNNIVLTSAQADAIQFATNRDTELLAALAAGARLANPDGSITTLEATVANDAGFFSRQAGSIGSYNVSVGATGTGSDVTTTLRVIVATGAVPELTLVPTPLVIPISEQPGNISLEQIMAGTSAHDPEDSDLTASIIVDQNGDGQADAITIAANVPGVTKVVYSVTDSDHNTTTASRAIIIDDGSFIYDEKYVLYANSFVIDVADVSTTDRPGQIKTFSNAAAWRVDGTALPTARVSVASEGGYQKVIGEYAISLVLLDDATLTRNITAKVYSDAKAGTNGNAYAIVAEDFIINVTDANAIAASAQANIESEFIYRAGAWSYKRSGNLSFEEGTKLLVSALHQVNWAEFASFAGTLAEGDRFGVTFWVDEDQTATVTVTLVVSNRTAPVLSAPVYKSVDLNADFSEGTFADANPSYMQGVSATDSEDGVITTISHDRPVDTTREGFYRVGYSVTDADYNTKTAVTMVFVGDYIVVPGQEYAIAGKSPVRLALSEVDAANADLRAAAKIVAWKLDDGSLSATALSPAQIPAEPGSHTVRFSVVAEPTLYLDVVFMVDDDRLSLTYYGNGATSGNPPTSALYFSGDTAYASDQGSLQRSGYTFGGWSFTGNGGAAYQAGEAFRVYEDMRLYAVWVAIPVPPVVQPPTVIVQPPTTVVVQQPAPVVVPGATTIVEVPVPYESATSVEEATPAPPELAQIEDEETPLANIETGSWSLISLLMSVLAFMAAIILAFVSLRRRKDETAEAEIGNNMSLNSTGTQDQAEKEAKRLNRIRLLSGVVALLGLAPAVVFLVLDDLTARMVVANGNTLFVAIAFAVVCALIIIRLVAGRKPKQDSGDDDGSLPALSGSGGQPAF